MEQPKEPGFYWARLGLSWEPVQLVDWTMPNGNPGPRRVLALGAEESEPLSEVKEWGPRIEPPGAHGWRLAYADHAHSVVWHEPSRKSFTCILDPDATRKDTVVCPDAPR
jgi:hypothetical protein